MQELWDQFTKLLDAQQIIHKGGFYLILFVVFAETGLFFGFFLPGDYLLFLAGMFVATGRLDVGIITMVIGLIFVASAGNFVGYWFGYRTGPMLYKRKDSFFFKQKYLKAAEAYYRKQGAFALIMGRFVPIVRTFAPIIAGVVKLDFKRFAFYNIVGAIIWITSLTFLGYFLGKKFELEIEKYLGYIILGFVIITTIPLVLAFFKKNINKIKQNNLDNNDE
ncbi:DedA family protein [Pedobacter alpinus]|uniref:DedA family protein n=1 Tax=Pedobacter alpinus TaxID=1590643 RepID=A0ABW5TMX3_9SPHI